MKRFSEIQKKSKLRRINEADEAQANLPQNFQDMSKEELIQLMSGKKETNQEENKEKSEEREVEVSEGGDVSKFISKLLESREMAQVYHWTVKGDMGSHAAHLALEAYYSGVIEFIDDIVEIYQGQYGLIEGYDIIDTTDSKSKDRLDYFKETVEFVKSARKCIKAEDTHIHNIIDELIALQYKTIYKLTYNK
jgi:Sec7-like guanine-nucleotide exchange factor